MIHNKQYYVDKYDKAWNKVKSEIEKRGEDPEVVGVTDEWDQTATPEEIAGYYLDVYEEDAYETWLENLDYEEWYCKDYKEMQKKVTTILKDLEDLEVINSYIMEVANGNGEGNDSLMNIHEYINERMDYEFNTSDVLLTNMSNELLSSLNSISALIGENLDSILLTYNYKTNKISAYLSNDFTCDDYPVELNEETVEEVRELFEDAVEFKQEYEQEYEVEKLRELFEDAVEFKQKYEKETTTETKGNTVCVTIYDAQEDSMLSSAGLRATTEISFDNVRGITYEGEYCVIWYNDTKISFRIKEIAMITFGNK